MVQNGIEKIKDHWIDNVFRSLRKLAKLENSILVLITAEVIAAIYYKGLQRATNSKTLWAICERILIDEEMHINFQSYTLRAFYKQKSGLKKRFSRLAHRILMASTTVVVWAAHGNVLKSGGYNFSRFVKEVFQEFNRSERMIKGEENIPLKLTLGLNRKWNTKTEV